MFVLSNTECAYLIHSIIVTSDSPISLQFHRVSLQIHAFLFNFMFVLLRGEVAMLAKDNRIGLSNEAQSEVVLSHI